MKISHVEIKNIMGIKGLEFEPGKVTVIDGKNGLGKTSVLNALQDAIGGGHNATLLANGEDKGEIVLVFDDGMKLEKKIKRESSKVSLKDGRGKEIPRAASFLKEIVDDICVNPIKILTSSSKDRVKQLLDSVPMKTPFKEIEDVTGKKMDRKDDRHPMQIIDRVRSVSYEERAVNNRFLKEKEGQINQLRSLLPPLEKDGKDRDFNAEIDKNQEKHDALVEEVQDMKESSAEWLNNKKEEMRGAKDGKIAALNAEFDRHFTDHQANHQEEIDRLADTNRPKVVALNIEIGELTALRDQAASAADSIRYVKTGDIEIKGLEDKTETLSKIISQLDEIKAKLLGNLPIKGMEVKDGEIYLDGVAFDSVNKAKRVKFALSIAQMRSAQLPIVCVDSLEALDAESFKLFQEQAAETDMQFFVTRVSDNPELTVNSK